MYVYTYVDATVSILEEKQKSTRDAEEGKKRKMARSRFRSLIRSVSLNRIWLVDAAEQKLSLNVKKNIAMLVRTQRKIGLLTMAEKSLIRTHHAIRTVDERKQLVSLMSGLNCFNKIPPKVRARLAKCVKFMVIGPGRTLIKEGDWPMMVYFILTGEVEVSKNVFDHIQNCWVNRIEKICGPGDCLGDAELIERNRRRHTYTTTNVVELLVVFEEDFELVLRPVMEQQWIEKKSAIMALNYFNFFTTDQITNACKLCVLRQFEPLETIYYEDKGQMSYVHFVISGECMILQCLKMVSQKNGVKAFDLTDIAKEGSKSIFQDLSNTQVLQILKDENGSVNRSAYDINEIIASDDNETNKQSAKSRDFKQIDIKSMEIRCGLAEPSYRGSAGSHTQFSEVNNNKIADKIEIKAEQSRCRNEQIVDIEDCENINGKADTRSNISKEEEIARKEDVPEMRSSKTEYLNTFSNQKSFDNQSQREIEEGSNRNGTKRFTLQSLRDSIRESLYGSSSSAEIQSHQRPTGKIENHFIDVGSLTFGSIFGLGEKLEHRVIMARTTVQCLMIPRFWLLEKDQNPGNIWQRRRFYLDTTIPSRQTLFKDFLYTRQWQKFKTKLIQSHLNPNSIANPTRVQDIPIICRIVEARDD
ncbi:uncharacterized protein LOC119616274 isoform X2 [Lucilia sericata]|uniref:uncharacterized protein LOC119616274 isoform X2 n=1 Tax=Lucilia sericata TaxID=13632 RepID=UPI0018A86D9D|nr:uncharacterized protein LOC119616274 isoform X2 [Lucilia sericata]